MWFTIGWVALTLALAFLAGYLAKRISEEIAYSISLEREIDNLRHERWEANVNARWEG